MRQAGPASTGSSSRAGPQTFSPSGTKLVPRWRRSPCASWAARSRTRTRRRCASGCSATATARSSGAGDVAVVNTCCVTHEAVSKSRQAVSRAARTHGRVYVTGCAANLDRRIRAGCAERHRACAAERRGARCRRRRRRRDRLRAGAMRGSSGTRAFVKIQDGCSFSCSFCVIPLVAGSDAQPPRAERCSRRSSDASRRATARSSSPASTSAASATARPATRLPRLVREAGALPGRRAASGCRPSR